MEHIADNSSLKVAGNWMALWKAKAPNKFKLLLWRSLRNVLPTRENLRKKGVPCTSMCPYCEAVAENTWHAFFGCDKAVECWRAARLWEDIRDRIMYADGYVAAVFQLLESLNNHQIVDLMNTIWCIWRRRNDRAWRGEEIPAKEAVRRSKEFTQDWSRLRRDDGRNIHLTGAANLTWTKPKQGEFKCNLDAAIFHEENQFGIGICIRNDHGQFITAKTVCLSGSLPVHEAEAIGLLESLIWVFSLGFNKMVFEMDCKSVVDDIMEGHNYHTEHGTILKQCSSLLKSFNNYENDINIDHKHKLRHDLPRHQVKQVICSLCGTEQEVQQNCINCGVCMGKYFCETCKLFDDDISMQQYHCNGFGICRTGGQKNFFHCYKCGCCHSTQLKNSHPCVEGGGAELRGDTWVPWSPPSFLTSVSN